MRAPSIMQTETECFITGARYPLDLHHIYEGCRRKASDKWGCWVYLRHDIHMAIHQRDTDILNDLKQICQYRFESLYGHEKFMQVFGKNYIMEDEHEPA